MDYKRYIMSVSASALCPRSIFPFVQELRTCTARLLRKRFNNFSTFRTKHTPISCPVLPVHSSYDRYSLSSKNYEPHTFYRNHFWWFSTFRTKNIHISFLFVPAHSHRSPFIESISGGFSHLERRIYRFIIWRRVFYWELNHS